MKGRSKKRLIAFLIAGILGCQITACTPVTEEEISQIEQENYQAEAGQAEVEQISTENYAYQSLSQEERQVYDEILSVILNHQEKIMLSCTDEEVMRKAYTAVLADYGGLFWIEGYVFTKYTKGEEVLGLEFAPNYIMTEEERQQTQQQIDSVVDEWLAGISITDTDYDKVKYIYNLLSTKVSYVEGVENSQNIISVFLNGQSVCQGYACAVQYLMEQLGIECVLVSGTALGEAHAWNLFQMDDEYYYMDATWGRGRYLEGETEKFFVDYKYMTMTTEEMLRSHIPGEELILPECTEAENNYYIQEGKYIREWKPEELGQYISLAYAEKEILTLRFADKGLYTKARNYFIEEGNIVNYCQDIEKISYMEDETWLEISFCFLE